MGENWLEKVQQEGMTGEIMAAGRRAERYGLTLDRETAEVLAVARKDVLREQRRVEFGAGILPKLIYEFSDSAYMEQESYGETLARLQEIFYLYKNETNDELTDDELLHFMREQYENVCFGDLDYLEGTCLNIFAQAVRAGYEGYKESQGYGEYGRLDEVKRWDYELYLQALSQLF